MDEIQKTCSILMHRKFAQKGNISRIREREYCYKVKALYHNFVSINYSISYFNILSAQYNDSKHVFILGAKRLH